MLRRALSLLVAVLLLAGHAVALAAQCTTRDDARVLSRSVKKRAACASRAFRSATASKACLNPPAPPACAGTIVDDTIALAFGTNNPPAGVIDRTLTRDQYRCQKQIGKASAKFVADEVKYLIRGFTLEKAQTIARRQLDRVPLKCAVQTVLDPSGVVIPSVGAPCQGNVDQPARAVLEADGLRACLVAALQTRVDAIAPVPPARPNLIIILTDDQRWDTTDLTHSLDGVTPVMPNVENRLAAAGVKFPNAYVSTALCCPSRSSILRGEYAHTTGVLSNTQPIGGAANFDDSSSLATWLSAAGYRTGLFGKYLNGYNTLWTLPAPPYVPPGWNEWHAFKGTKFYDYILVESGVDYPAPTEVSYPSTCTNYTGCPADQPGEDPCPSPQNYSTDVLAAKVLQFLDQSAGQPFFLYFAPFAPHAPACAAPGDEDSFAALPAWRPPNWNTEPSPDPPAWDANLCPMGPGKMNNIDNFRRKQLASLQAVDRVIGAIMDKLVALGQDQNTFILFTGDNGYSWGAHCHAPKRCPYDECMHVPLVISYPPVTTPARVDTRIGLNIDFAFTFGELAGVVPPIQEDGRSMVRLVDDTEPAWRTDFVYEQWLDPDDEDNDVVPPTLASVRSEQFMYTEYVGGETELYDLIADPFELTNLTNNPAYVTTKAEMAARLRQLRPDWTP